MVGTVVAAGPDVAEFEIGDRVGGVVFEDVYAEIVLADPRRTRPDLVTQRRTELWDLLAAGRLNPQYVDLPLEAVTKAIDLVATRSNLGRVVLRTR